MDADSRIPENRSPLDLVMAIRGLYLSFNRNDSCYYFVYQILFQVLIKMKQNKLILCELHQDD